MAEERDMGAYIPEGDGSGVERDMSAKMELGDGLHTASDTFGITGEPPEVEEEPKAKSGKKAAAKK